MMECDGYDGVGKNYSSFVPSRWMLISVVFASA